MVTLYGRRVLANIHTDTHSTVLCSHIYQNERLPGFICKHAFLTNELAEREREKGRNVHASK